MRWNDKQGRVTKAIINTKASVRMLQSVHSGQRTNRYKVDRDMLQSATKAGAKCGYHDDRNRKGPKDNVSGGLIIYSSDRWEGDTSDVSFDATDGIRLMSRFDARARAYGDRRQYRAVVY